MKTSAKYPEKPHFYSLHFYSIIKKIGDIIISGGLLIFLFPILAVISLIIALTMGFPIIFKQLRPGRYERPFFIYKFRTMIGPHGLYGQILSDGERLTSFCRWLRRTSLDELPELYNVLKGDMSLIGPRPLLMEYLELYSLEESRRHEVKPGITGWAQVNGRNALTWDEKFRFDVWYVDNISFCLDLKIIALTVWKVLSREGINEPGQVTMSKFIGNSVIIQKGEKNDKK